MRFYSLLGLVALGCLASGALADEYTLVPLDAPPPADAAPAAIAEQLAGAGFKVMRGATRTVCEIWPVKQWTVKADFSPTISMLYPLQMGQLLGVIRFPRSYEDFRGQTIESGVYTLRFALQPEDGNHVGTSDTRDFVLLLPAADDTDPATLDYDKLISLSQKAAGTTHPAMMSLLAADGPEPPPAIDHDEDREYFSLRFSNKASGGKSDQLTLELVIIGRAAE